MSASSSFIRSNSNRVNNHANIYDDSDENLIRSYGRTRPCPHCGNSIARVRSRPIDRFVNLFHPVYRYKCFNTGCAWEGSLGSVRVIDEEIFI
jgi:hypothetical protein